MGYSISVYVPTKEPVKNPNNEDLRERIKAKLREIPEFKECVVLYTIHEIE